MTDRERLRHDVVKYLVRVSRNLKDGPVPAALVELLIRDLYESPSGGRPSARFAALASAIEGSSASSIARRFARLDALEAEVRARDANALRAAADLALEIGRSIEAAVETRLETT